MESIWLDTNRYDQYYIRWDEKTRYEYLDWNVNVLSYLVVWIKWLREKPATSKPVELGGPKGFHKLEVSNCFRLMCGHSTSPKLLALSHHGRGAWAFIAKFPKMGWGSESSEWSAAKGWLSPQSPVLSRSILPCMVPRSRYDGDVKTMVVTIPCGPQTKCLEDFIKSVSEYLMLMTTEVAASSVCFLSWKSSDVGSRFLDVMAFCKLWGNMGPLLAAHWDERGLLLLASSGATFHCHEADGLWPCQDSLGCHVLDGCRFLLCFFEFAAVLFWCGVGVWASTW